MTRPRTAGRVEGKVVVITGASQGMGTQHARTLVDHGATVVVTDVDAGGCQTLAAELGDRAIGVRLDVTRPEDWADVVGTTIDRFGRVDGLVNNAGVLRKTPLDAVDLAGWSAVLNVNLTGTYLGAMAVLPQMRAQSAGSIINVSSVDGLRGSEGLHAYVASKFGVTGLTKSLAVEIAAEGVRVNSVHPGLILTPMAASLGATRLAIPAARGGTPAEVSMLVLYLLSDESRYCTGAEFVVDGGLTAGIPHLDSALVRKT